MFCSIVVCIAEVEESVLQVGLALGEGRVTIQNLYRDWKGLKG